MPSTRHARRGALDDHLVEAELAQVLHRAREGADARHDDAVGARGSRRGRASAAAARRRARTPSRPSGGCPCRSRRSRLDGLSALMRSASPSCSARRSRVGSIADGRAQRARERLEQRLDHVVDVRARLDASGAASASRCVGDARGRTPPPARGRSCRSRRAAASASNGEERAARRRRSRSDARASSIGTVADAVADDPGAVAERRVERLAEADADVLDGVVRARLAGRRSPPPRGRGGRGARAGRACGRGSRRPVARAPAPVPSSVERQAHVGLAGSCGGSRRCGSSRSILPDARLHRLRVGLEALRARDRGAVRRPARRPPPAAIRTSAMRRRNVRAESPEA